MTNLARVRVTWSSATVVGGGLSTFYFDASGSGFQSALVSYFTAVKDRHAPGTQWTIPANGDILVDTSGLITGSWSEGTQTTVTAAGSVSFVNGTGLRVVWNTNGVHNRRRVRGSTFHAPLTSDNFEGLGNIVGSTLTTFQTAATALIAATSTDFRIWSRPPKGATTGGASSLVVSASAPDKVAWLRSRRL